LLTVNGKARNGEFKKKGKTTIAAYDFKIL